MPHYQSVTPSPHGLQYHYSGVGGIRQFRWFGANRPNFFLKIFFLRFFCVSLWRFVFGFK